METTMLKRARCNTDHDCGWVKKETVVLFLVGRRGAHGGFDMNVKNI